MSANPAPEEPPPHPEPVAGSGRLATLDFIRGIAVLGILLANIVGMSHPLLAYEWPEATGHPPGLVDSALWLAQYVFIDGKMRGLFSLLFGAGIFLFLERAWARADPALLQARRLLWLLLFGLAHFFLLFWGDILFLYAIAGLAVLAMAGWQRETQLRFGIVWYLAGSLMYASMGFSAMQLEVSEAARQSAPDAWEVTLGSWDRRLEDADTERAVFGKGDYGTEIAFVANERSAMLGFYPLLAILETIPLMLIGMGLYRYGLFDGGLDPGRQRRWGWIGVLAGAAMALAMGLWVVLSDFPPFLTGFAFNGGAQAPRLPMIVGLTALLALWAPRAALCRLGQRIVAAGRMALSNYIGSSLVALLVFRHWAGGLWGELDRTQLWLVVLAVWLLILAWSQPWLARFRYGPLEYLWRCLTYWRVFPFRR